jgi:Protein of unknown function (DUF3485)
MGIIVGYAGPIWRTSRRGWPLTRNRSDGALVRLVTPLKPGEDWSDADGCLHAFAKIAVPALQEYIPD